MTPLRSIVGQFAVIVEGLDQLDKANSKMDKTAKKLQSLGAMGATAVGLVAIGAGVAAITNNLISAGWEVDKLSERMGVSVQEFQQWKYAAEQTGASVTDFANGVKILQKNISDATQGGASGKLFGKLGINVRNANGDVKTAAEVMGDLADAVGKAKSDAEKTGIALHTLGKGGVALLPLLKQGRTGVEGLTKRFQELGGGLSDKFVKAATAAKRAQLDLGTAALGLKDHLGVQLLPAVTWITEKLTDLTVASSKLLHNTNAVRTAMLGVGTASILSGIKLSVGVASKLGIVGKVAEGASRGVLGTVGALGKLAWQVGKFGFALLVAFLILEDFYTFLSGGKSLIGQFIDNVFGKGQAEKFRQGILEIVPKVKEVILEAMPYLKTFALATAQFLKDLLHGFKGYGTMFSEFFMFLGQDIAKMFQGLLDKEVKFFQDLGKNFTQFGKDHPLVFGALKTFAGLGTVDAGSAVRGAVTSGSVASGNVSQHNETTIQVVGQNAAAIGKAVAGEMADVYQDNANTIGAVIRP